MTIILRYTFFVFISLRLLHALIPTANVVVFYSSSGNLANASDSLFLGQYWASQLRRKSTIPGWPVNVTVEFLDAKSSSSRVSSLLTARISNRNLSDITTILAPFGTGLTYAAAMVTVKRNIPIVSPGSSPYATTNGVVYSLPFLSSTFFVGPPGLQFTTTTAIDAFLKVNAKTVVVAYLDDPTYPGMKAACLPVVESASKRGLSVLGQFKYSLSNSTNDLYNIVMAIKQLEPDVLVWCDVVPCLLASRVPYHPLPLFKKANYLPKAFTFGDCLDTPLTKKYYDQGLYNFVSSSQYYNAKCRGPDYTEDSTPYSSLFRPATPTVFTVKLVCLYLLTCVSSKGLHFTT